MAENLKTQQDYCMETTSNLAISAMVARTIDFNEQFPLAAGEDIEFCVKANLSGFEITFNPSMLVYHNYGYNGSTLHDIYRFYRQFKRYGQGEKQLLQVIPEYYHLFDKTEEIPVCTREID